MPDSTDKPIVRCLIARKLGTYTFGRTQIVTLDVAWCAVQTGQWFAVGPDPADMEALALWERANTPPFNQARMP